MGFGLLVIGYMFLLGLMPTYNFFISYLAAIPLAATVVVIIALKKLSLYEKLFGYTLYGALGLFFIAACGTVYEYGRLLGWLPSIGESYDLIMFALKLVCSAYFNIMLLNAIGRLAAGIGAKRLVWTAKRNLWFQMIYYALAVVAVFSVSAPFWQAFGMLIILFGFACFILNLITIYTSYMRIALEPLK